MGAAFMLGPLLVGALLLVGACVWGLLGLLIMREISGLEFVLYSGIFLSLVVMGGLGKPPFGAAALLIAAILAIAFPLARYWGNAAALAMMDRQDIARYKLTVEKRPELPYPYRKLAEIYYRQGHYGAAAEWYQKYVTLTNDPEVKFRIRRCQEMMEKATERVKLCTECRHENPGDARYCVNCGAILPGVWEIIQAFRGKAGTRYLLTVALLSLALGVVLGLVSQLNHIYAMTFFLIAGAALVYLLYKRVTAY